VASKIVYPKIRFVDAFPVEQAGQTFFLVRDPLEIAPSPLIMSSLDFIILNMFDGSNNLSDIKMKFAKRFGGVLLSDEQIYKIIEILDENYYLDTPQYREHYQKIMNEFKLSGIRKPWHSGSTYEADPEKLTRQIESFYIHPEGTGISNGKILNKNVNRKLSAIMAPHIDLRVGGPCYTHAYSFLRNEGEADLYIILGVAHYGGSGKGLFIATAKDFETPLGVVKTDKEFLEKWMKNSENDLTEDEWVHRTEHSIEFQLPFMQHALKHRYKILPVLCGSIEPYLQNGNRIEEHPETAAMINALKKTIREEKKRVIFILSVDLAHMGPKFGDPEAITETEAQRIKEADYQMFDIVSRLDSGQFVEMMKDDLFSRRVDACTAIYILLSIMEKGSGETVGYGQNYQPDTGSLVSYGSMVFYETVS
jgi:AmmeMemoRadiSam system protein B